MAAESFPNFDLTVLTRKQLDMLVMRYRGDLSWTKIARFEGVRYQSIQDRHKCAMGKLQAQIPVVSSKDRGTTHATYGGGSFPRTVADDAAAPLAGSLRRSGAAEVAAEGGGCSTFLSWEELSEQETEDYDGGAGSECEPR